MKHFLIVFASIFVISCASTNSVSSNTKKQSNEKVANNNGDYCRKARKTGSRMNTRQCVSKEQRNKEREQSKDAMRNALNGQTRVTPNVGEGG